MSFKLQRFVWYTFPTMKKKILLIDESLTVQKVVTLTLDKAHYVVSFAKSRAEAMKLILEGPPDLIMVSDQVADLSYQAFPKEVEAWLGKDMSCPPMILITGRDIREQRHYGGILRKPFAPQALNAIVSEYLKIPSAKEEHEEQRLQKRFDETFSDESKLVRETFKQEVEADEPTLANISVTKPKGVSPATQEVNEDLWRAPTPVRWTEAEEKIKTSSVEAMIEKALAKMVPAIVERMVQERLDKLLKDQEQFFELKP